MTVRAKSYGQVVQLAVSPGEKPVLTAEVLRELLLRAVEGQSSVCAGVWQP